MRPFHRFAFIFLAFAFSLKGIAGDTHFNSPEINSNYFIGDCDSIVASLNAGDVEGYFLDRVKSKDHLIQLLYDYRLVFDPDFSKALLLSFPELGILGEVFSPDEVQQRLKAGILKLKELYEAPHELMISRLGLFVQNLVDLKSAHDEFRDEAQARVEHLRLSRLVKGIRANGKLNDLFEETLIELVRESALHAGLMLEGRLLRLIENDVVGTDVKYYLKPMSFIILTGAAGFLFGKYAIGGNVDPAITSISATGGVVLGVLMSLIPKLGLFPSKRRPVFEAGSAVPKKYTVSKSSKDPGPIDITASVIFLDLEKKISSGVLSLEAACQKALCKINPIELAYLGFIDFLELKSNLEALQSIYSSALDEANLSEAKRLAQLAINSSDSIQSKMQLKRFLERWLKAAEVVANSYEGDRKKLLAREKSIDESIQQLRDRPFSAPLESATNEDMLKLEVIYKRLEGDLRNLAELKLNHQALDQRMSELVRKRTRIQDILSRLPKSHSGWEVGLRELIKELEQWPN